MHDKNNLNKLKIKQASTLDKIKKKHLYFQKKKFKNSFDLPVYITKSGDSFGNLYSNYLAEGKIFFFKSLYIIIKNLFSICYLTKYKLIFNKKFNYKKLIVTWAFKKNFLTNGSFHDRYFNINSRTAKNTLWFVIFMDKTLPSKVDKNIFLLQSNIEKEFSPLKIIKILLNNLKYLLKDITYFNFMISKHRYFAEIVLNVIKRNVRTNLSNILIPYEGQPFQNYILKYFSTEKKIKSTGYIHAPPMPFPSNYVKKKYSPTKIIVNGKDQMAFFKKLGWKKREISFMPSNRFTSKKKNFSQIIFLPIFIKSSEDIIQSLQLLRDKLAININSFKVKNHPAADSFKEIIKLIKKIKKIKNLKNIKKFNRKSLSIFIGSTGAIIEALERGNNVIQITEEPLFELYSNKIWKSIKSEQISKNIFSYKLISRGNLLNLGKKPRSINNFFVN